MRVCLISNQIAAWGKVGGYGTATRAIGAGLARRGVEVHAAVVRRGAHGQRRVEHLDGITVHGMSAWQTMTGGRVFREIDADIYHSQEPTVASRLAQWAAPQALHIVSCRDPRTLRDHLIELRHANARRRLIWPLTWWYDSGPLVRAAVRRADAVFCPALFLRGKIRRLNGMHLDPQFVPSPVEVPEREPVKAAHPTVIFVGRWDRRKRIEVFFDLVRRCPEIRFVAIGNAQDKRYDLHLRRAAGGLPNLEMPGFVSRFDAAMGRHLEKAWVLVNTSAREGLPYTFIEAAAWGCAILAPLDPDNFASRFGCLVEDGDFEAGLRYLLDQDRWRQRGREGAAYVRGTFAVDHCIDEHLRRYRELLHERC